MKQRFSSLDVKVIAYELSKSLVSLRVANIYDLSSRIFLFKLGKPGTRLQLLADVGFRCHLTNFVRTTAAAPSPFVSRLRKYLKSRRITAVSQVGTDRVIEIVFSDGQYRIFLEFFAAGNIVLTDKEYIILALFRNVSEGNEEVDVRLGVRYPLAEKQNHGRVLAITDAHVREVLEAHVALVEAQRETNNAKKVKKRGGDELKRAIARGFPEYPIHLLDHAFSQTSFDPSVTVAQALDDANLVSSLVRSILLSNNVFQSLCQTDQPKGYIIAKARDTAQSDIVIGEQDARIPPRDLLLYEDFHPFKPCQFEYRTGTYVIEIDGFNKTVDEFYSSLETQRLESRLTERQDNAKRKIDSARQQHESRIGALQQVQELHIRRAEAVRANAHRVEEVIAAVNGLIGQGMDWMDIAKLIENEQSGENIVAQMIKLPLKLYENTITVLLDEASEEVEADEDYETEDVDIFDEGEPDADSKKVHSPEKRLAIDIDLALSAWANARIYYEQKKNAAQKEQKTLQASSKALKSTEQKITADMKKGLKQEKDVLRPARKQFWFEKFWYFISSDGYLVLGAKDAQQKDLLYRRYLKRGDVYVDADLQGAASVVVKNSIAVPDAPIPPSTLSQAGSLVVCTSSAWDSKAVMAAWWVDAHQVSKTTLTGDYLATGGFVIEGNKNFLPPAQLLLGFSVLFCISEDSKANHNKHRLRDDEEVGVGISSRDVNERPQDTSHGDHEGSGPEDHLEHDGEVGYSSSSETDGGRDSSKDGDSREQSEDDFDAGDQQCNEAANPLQPGNPHGKEDIAESAAVREEALDAGGQVEAEHPDQESGSEESQNVEEQQDSEIMQYTKEPDHIASTIDSPTQQPSSSSPSVLQTQLQSPPDTKAPFSTPRGKNTKASKRALAKYAQQDDEERTLALHLLGSTKAQQKKESAAVEKASREAKLAVDRERRRAQHDRAAIAEKKRNENKSKKSNRDDENAENQQEQEEQDQIEDEELLHQEHLDLLTLPSLIPDPHPDDQILFAIPHVAPWTVLTKAKYKVKLQPGNTKKGKAVREIVGRWLAGADAAAKQQEQRRQRLQLREQEKRREENDGNRGQVVEQQPELEKSGLEEKEEIVRGGGKEEGGGGVKKEIEAVRAWRLEEVFACLPVGGVRLVAGPGAASGSSKAKSATAGGGKTKAKAKGKAKTGGAGAKKNQKKIH